MPQAGKNVDTLIYVFTGGEAALLIIRYILETTHYMNGPEKKTFVFLALLSYN